MDTPIILTNMVINEEEGKHKNGLASTFIVRSATTSKEECDCACPSPSFPSSIVINGGQTWQRVSGLYESQIGDDFTLLFDPMGLGKMAVLNSSALRVLNAFSSPLAIMDIPTKTPNIQPKLAIMTAKNMAALGLLQSGPESHRKPDKASTDTLTAWLHITNECNLRCDYCYLHKTHEAMSLDLGYHAVDAVFRSAQSQSFREVKLKYAGGESTLEFNMILSLHDYAKEQANKLGFMLTGVVLSNGIGISNQMINSLNVRNIRLSISLDGIGEYHDMQRKFQNGKGSFDLVKRTLSRLRRLGVIPSITITVSQRNAKGLPQIVEYLLSQELPFSINFFRDNEYSASFKDLVYQDEVMIDAMKAAFTKIENNLPPFSILGTITDRARLDTPHLQPCGVGHSYMVIDQQGKVAKCHMEIGRTFSDVYTPDPLKTLQLDTVGIQNHSVEDKDGCQKCEWRYYCAGGCPALTYRVTGRYDVQSPNCRIYKALFPEVLRLEGLRLLKYGRLREQAADNIHMQIVQ